MALVTAIHLRGTRAAQPAASSANAGYIYCVTDESNILERSSGSAWQAYSPTGTGTGTVTNTGALTSGAIVKGNGGVDVSTTTTGTGVLTALGVNTGSTGAFVVNGGALGTPSSGTLTNGTGLPFTTGLTGIVNAYLLYQDQETSGTNGGTFTSGAWQTRVLNTEVNDAGGLGSLSSNQVTLSAGTYLVRASAPGFACNGHQTRLQNVTDATTLVTGATMFARTGASSSESVSNLFGVFTVAESKALELQHRCETTSATIGFGVPGSFNTEIYAMIEFLKIG